MGTTKLLRYVLAMLTLLTCVALAGPGRAADDDDLRKKALKLNDVTGDEPMLGQLRALVKDKEGTKKLLAVATEMAKDKKQPFNVTATYILARSALILKENEAAETFYRIQLEQCEKTGSGRKLSDATAGLIQVLCARKKYDEAEKVTQKFLELDEDQEIERLKYGVLRTLIIALMRSGEVDKATDKIERLVKAQPENWLNLELKAQVLREAGKYEDAAKTYEEMMERAGKDDRLDKKTRAEFVDEIRYSLSGVLVELKQIDKAADHLKALLEKDPDNPTYNNDLGYIWADHDMNLAESEKMIRKALEKDREQQRKANPDAKDVKDNAAYLDSLGWVLFKQKKYKEAKPYLEQAAKDEDGQHIEILDHLGEVNLALGEKAAAVAAWKKGLEVAGPSKREQDRKAEVEKKIKAAQ
jgi:tetratricopeptide (TPR) repeat protein